MNKFRHLKIFLLIMSIISAILGIFAFTLGNIYAIISCCVFFEIPFISIIFIREIEKRNKK